MYQSGDIILNMNQNNQDNNDEDNNCKPSVQEKKQADEKKADKEDQSDYLMDVDKPPKKKRQRVDHVKSRFSLGCEIFQKDLDLDTDDEPGYIDQRKFRSMAQEAQQKIHELDTIRSGYKQIVDAYQDLYQ